MHLWTSSQFRKRSIGGIARQLVDVVQVEHFEANCVTHTLTTGLHPCITSCDTTHRKEGTNSVVFDEQSVGVGNQNVTPVIAIAHRHLRDSTTNCTSSIIRSPKQFDFARFWNVSGIGLDVITA